MEAIMDEKTAALTPEEESEFTLLNCVAFDNQRTESKARGEKGMAFWLVQSPESREEARQALVPAMSKLYGLPLANLAAVKRLVADGTNPAMIRLVGVWKNLEIEAKRRRVEGHDFMAYFCPHRQ